MTNYIFVGVSLDGFIAGKDGDLGWLNEIPNPSKSDYGYAEFIENIDALVMGRNTFEKVLSFGGGAWDKPVFVLSNTLNKAPTELKGKVEIVKGDLKTLVARALSTCMGHNNKE